MGDIRDRAKEVLSVVPPHGQQVNSVGQSAALFTKLTGGVTHDTLAKNWAKGGIMTTCNAFTGWYAKQLGSKLYLGRFDLDTFLPKSGKGNAWVKSAPDVRPKYGDICRHTSFHVSVCLDFEGDVWNRAESGQGGPKIGYDIIRRTRDSKGYDPKRLQGWVDLDLYFDSAPTPQTGPVPEWLVGWWEVTWRGEDYYYYFDRNHQVTWTERYPRNLSYPATVVSGTGAVTIEVPSSVKIRWSSSGSIEKFSRLLTKDAPMRGIWNDKEPLTASKL